MVNVLQFGARDSLMCDFVLLIDWLKVNDKTTVGFQVIAIQS